MADPTTWAERIGPFDGDVYVWRCRTCDRNHAERGGVPHLDGHDLAECPACHAGQDPRLPKKAPRRPKLNILQ